MRREGGSSSSGITAAERSTRGKRQAICGHKQWSHKNNGLKLWSTPREPSPENSNNMQNKRNRIQGFTLVEIMIVVAIIGLLAAIAIPNFVRARNTSQKNACINNLRQIDGAKNQWALENKKQDTDTPANTDIQVYLKGNTVPSCPSNGNYTLNPVSTLPNCSLASSLGHTY
jgi:prepilin-type N-terminal cleavage/methylation domain-containing protein